MSPELIAQWTPEQRRWHARHNPRGWPDIERRLKAIENENAPYIIEWNAIRPTKVPRVRKIKVVEIIDLCAAYGGIKVEELTGSRRAMSISTYRMAAYYLAAEHCHHASLPEIGRRMGGRDHTTVLCGRNKVREDLDGTGHRFGDIVKHVEMRLGLR